MLIIWGLWCEVSGWPPTEFQFSINFSSYHTLHCTLLSITQWLWITLTHCLLLIWKRYVDIVRCAVHYLLEISIILVWESCPTFLTRHLRLTLLRDKFLHTLAKLRPNFVIRANKNIQFRPHRTHAATLATLSLTRSPNRWVRVQMLPSYNKSIKIKNIHCCLYNVYSIYIFVLIYPSHICFFLATQSLDPWDLTQVPSGASLNWKSPSGVTVRQPNK